MQFQGINSVSACASFANPKLVLLSSPRQGARSGGDVMRGYWEPYLALSKDDRCREPRAMIGVPENSPTPFD